jgi:hypothetical protein
VLITHEIEGRYFNRAKPEDGERESEQHSPGTASPTPSQNPVPPAPENQPARDPRRQVDQAQSQLPADDPYAGLPNDQLSLPPVRPDELSNLLTASTSGQSFNPLVRPLSVNTLCHFRPDLPPTRYRARPEVIGRGGNGGRKGRVGRKFRRTNAN